MTIPFLLLLQVASPPPPPPAAVAGDSSSLILESPSEVAPGDTLAVRVRTADYGYLVVFHVDPGGRIGLLHPRGPTGDQAVRGHRVYRLRPPAGDRAFQVEARPGKEMGAAQGGFVAAAIARNQFRLGLLAHSGGWDRGWVGQVAPGEGAEGYLRRLLEELARTADVEVVVVPYRVRAQTDGEGGAGR